MPCRSRFLQPHADRHMPYGPPAPPRKAAGSGQGREVKHVMEPHTQVTFATGQPDRLGTAGIVAVALRWLVLWIIQVFG